jgi:hypothetical protein
MQYFSPLFIGDSRSTTLKKGARMAGYAFQSPLHRGLAFNSSRIFHKRSTSKISVPSSSGTRVQRDFDPLISSNSANFSPLFIGDSRSTCKCGNNGGGDCVISVPSSSGTRVQRQIVEVKYRATPYFSPLFIGDSRSTAQQNAQDRQDKEFQSPLHRGLAFNKARPGGSSNLIRHFSPLFIGDSRSTLQNLFPFVVVYAISVPSSSGTRVQPLS